MTKAELESKHISELHALAAEAGVPRYRMLSREELVEKLATGGSQERSRPRAKREPSRQQQRKRGGRSGEPRERQPRRERQQRPKAEASAPPEREERDSPAPESTRRPRRRRRRRFGRRRKELSLRDLLLPETPGGYTIAYGETRESCTGLLREFAADLSGASSPDPIALLVDPGPEELAEWRREAPKAEIVAAAQARHAEDAIGQAVRRAEGGESVIVLIDSLTRFGETFKDTEAAKELLDAGRSVSSLTVVAALERR